MFRTRNRLLTAPFQGRSGAMPFMSNAMVFHDHPEGDDDGGGGGGGDDAATRAMLERFPEEFRGLIRSINEKLEAAEPLGKRVTEIGDENTAFAERLVKIERALREFGTGGGGVNESRYAQLRKEATPNGNGIRLGMSEDDVEQFSWSRAVVAQRDNDWSGCPFERQILGDTRAKRDNRNAQLDDGEMAARALLVTGTGANLLPVELQDFILAPLKNKNPWFRAGARLWENLKGTVEWNAGAFGELAARTDGTILTDISASTTFTKRNLIAQLRGALHFVSNQLLQENRPAADDFIVTEMRKAISRDIGAIGLTKLRTLTAVTDATALPAAGSQMKQTHFTRGMALLENTEIDAEAGEMALVMNALQKYHLLNSDEGAGRPWIPFATNASLKAASDVEAISYSAMNDDSGINGEALMGAFDNMVIGTFGDGIELAVSTDYKFGENLTTVRGILSMDAELFYDEAFLYWDALGDA